MTTRPDVYLHLREGPRKARLAIGPGKIALLESIEATGSITAAAKALKMSYRRAWVLLDETNRCLVSPAVETATGGSGGGGTTLTVLGRRLVHAYRALEAETMIAAARRVGPMLRSSRRRAVNLGARPGRTDAASDTPCRSAR